MHILGLLGITFTLFYLQINRVVFAIIATISCGGYMLGMLLIGQQKSTLSMELFNQDSITVVAVMILLVASIVIYSIKISKSVEIRLLKHAF